MSVLINNQSGLAEDLPQDQATAALQQGTHGLPLNDEQGNPVISSLADAPSLIQQGHSQPSPDQLNHLLEAAQYQTPQQQARAFSQGVMKSASFGISSGVLQALGHDKEEQQKLEQYNPGTETAGEVAGILGTGGFGAGNILSHAGEAAVAKLGIEGATAASRVGASAIKGAVETAIMQGGDEVSKAFLQDPQQSAETALTNIGMAGLLGGALGGGSKGAQEGLWQAAQGNKLTRMLSSIRSKVSGVADMTAADQAAQAVGINLSPEAKAAMMGEPNAVQMAEELKQSGSKAGGAFRQSIKQVEQDVSDSIFKSLGKSPEDIGALRDLSDYESGQKVQSALVSELKSISDPISAQFEPIKAKFASIDLPQGTHNEIGEKLNQMALKEGYALSESSPAMAEINRINKDIPNLKTLDDLRKYQSVARQNIMSTGVPQLGKQVSTIFRDAEENILNSALEKEAPELQQAHAAARDQYKNLMNTVDDLNDRLHAGKYYGPGSFINAVKEMAPEDVLRRIKGTNDANILKTLQESFPSTAEALKQYHVDNLLKRAVTAPGANETGINTRTLYRELDKMSPEMKDFAVPPSSLNTLESGRQLLSKLPKNINPSGTARTLDALWKKLPGGIGTVLSAITGHNPIMGYLMGELSQYIGREAPDAMKLSLLKFLGSAGEVEPKAFKTMVEIAHSAYEGNRVLSKAASSVVRDIPEVLADKYMPKSSDTDKIDKHLKAAELDPSQLTNKTANVATYMPEHAAALGMTMANTANYLNSLRPSKGKTNPLDSDRVPTAIESATYKRALDIAQQPLVTLDYIKKGTLGPNDIKSLSTMYPALYQSMKTKLMDSMTSHIAKGNIIPYKTQLGMSLFMGMPLNASIMPQAIMMNQTATLPRASPQGGPINQPRGSKQALKELPNLSATQSQARELDKKGS